MKAAFKGDSVRNCGQNYFFIILEAVFCKKFIIGTSHALLVRTKKLRETSDQESLGNSDQKTKIKASKCTFLNNRM